MGLQAGYALDLTSRAPDGKFWNFAKASDRLKCWKLLRRDRPYLLIGSPPRTAFSSPQNLSKGKPGEEERQNKLLEEARIHFECCVKLYHHQVRQGFYFLHKRPATATSWQMDSVKKLLVIPTVSSVVAHMCQVGMVAKDELGEGPVLKPARFVSNSRVFLRELDKKGKGCLRHAQLVNGRAAGAAIYPKGLCRAACRGVKRQLELGEDDMVMAPLIASTDEINAVEVCQMWKDGVAEGKQFWDDVSGKVLDSALTQEARGDEVRDAERMNVWTKVPRSECVNVTGKCPNKTRWADTNKGDDLHPQVRARLVAHELKRETQSSSYPSRLHPWSTSNI